MTNLRSVFSIYLNFFASTLVEPLGCGSEANTYASDFVLIYFNLVVLLLLIINEMDGLFKIEISD